MMLFAFTVAAIGLVALTFLFERPAFAVTLVAVVSLSLAPAFQDAAGTPADPDGRLHAEQWRPISIAALADSRFLVSVLYRAGDIRTYRLAFNSPEAKDRFLKAQGDLKKGKVLWGRAAHGRAGQISDDDMGFEMSEAPLEPKGPSP